jgi:pyruvate-formate lyase-activating enzyme
MTLEAATIIVCDGCKRRCKHPSNRHLEALRHARQKGWARGLMKHPNGQHRPTDLCPNCVFRHGSSKVLEIQE